MSILDYIKNELKISKKDLYAIPYWDRVRMSLMDSQPEFDTGCEHLHARQLDKRHYLLSQLVVSHGEYVKYEQSIVTIHGYKDRDHYDYKTYDPLISLWLE